MTNKSVFSVFSLLSYAGSWCHLQLPLQILSAGVGGANSLFRRLRTTCFKHLKRVVRSLRTTRAEALWHLFRGSVTPVPRLCDSCTTSMFTPCNINVHPVQRQCSPRATALFTPCNDLVHPVKWHCSLLWNAALSAVWWHREKCSKMLRKRRFSFLFVICHAFVATRKRLYTKAFSVMVTNKQIKTKICM